MHSAVPASAHCLTDQSIPPPTPSRPSVHHRHPPADCGSRPGSAAGFPHQPRGPWSSDSRLIVNGMDGNWGWEPPVGTAPHLTSLSSCGCTNDAAGLAYITSSTSDGYSVPDDTVPRPHPVPPDEICAPCRPLKSAGARFGQAGCGQVTKRWNGTPETPGTTWHWALRSGRAWSNAVSASRCVSDTTAHTFQPRVNKVSPMVSPSRRPSWPALGHSGDTVHKFRLDTVPPPETLPSRGKGALVACHEDYTVAHARPDEL
ncbi:hypothetical protein FZEAL_6789 [Fusarium zealandicum]|uniref:Uncharacterized protein n=1 Tax=Fusarium zealandicum TaxID=1053134 RepID=A0A8H4XIG2_9HYPO|nr:hypothetical protein FZEAL_6789 [Fusarium zealandicum]